MAMMGWLGDWWKEWQARRHGLDRVVDIGPAPDLADLRDRDIVLAPLAADLDRVLKLKSQAAPDHFYDLNLARLECSCEDFVDNRARWPLGDIRRVCKHLRMLLYRRQVLDVFDEVAQVLLRPTRRSGLRVQTGIREVSFHSYMAADGEVVLGREAGSAWTSVITRRGRKHVEPKLARYAHNPLDGRWSHDARPFAWNDISQAARVLVQDDRRRRAA
jgi:hypothetical protein